MNEQVLINALERSFHNLTQRIRDLEAHEPPGLMYNLAPNGLLTQWEYGNTPVTTDGVDFAPGWTLLVSTSTASVDKNTVAANLDAGSIANAKVTYTHAFGGYARIQQPALTNDVRQRPLALSARVKSTTPVRLYISYDGGVTFTYGDYSVGNGTTFETLTLSIIPPSTAINVVYGVEFATRSGVTYVDNVVLVENGGAVDSSIMPFALDRLMSGYLILRNAPSMTAPFTGRGVIYTKAVAGVSTPFFKADDNTEYNLLVPSISGLGQPVTASNDTNVTLTVGGLAATGGVNPFSVTVGWTGELAVTRGGTGASTAAGARTNLGLISGGTGDIWVHRAGDTMTNDLLFTDNSADVGATGGTSPRTLYAATSIVVGRVSVASGSIYLRGVTSGQVRIRPADIAGSWDWIVPTGVGTANYALTTDGAGVSSWSQISLTSGVTGVLPISNGGTGVNLWPSNKVVFTDGSGNLNTDSDLAFDGSILTATAINISGLTASRLVLTDGSKNLVSSAYALPATVAQGDVLYGSSTTAISALAKNATATRYLSNTGTSNNPAWAQVDLTNGVTGVLPKANGGTGTASWSSSQVVYTNGSGDLTTSAGLTFNGTLLTALNASGADVASFGRSATQNLTFSGSASGNFLTSYSDATNAKGVVIDATTDVLVTSPSAGSNFINLRIRGSTKLGIDDSGNINISGLTASRSVWTDASKNLVSSPYAMPATIAQGDILYGSSTTAILALAKTASATRYLSNTGTTNNPAWAQVNLTNGVTGILPIANGGTGAASWPAGTVPYVDGAGDLVTLSRFTFVSSVGVDQLSVGVATALEDPTGIFGVGNGGRAGGFQRDDSTTTIASQNATVALYNLNTTANNWTQLTAKTYDATGTPVIRSNASIKFLTTARTAGTVTGQLSFHTNNGTALTLTQIATMDSTGLNLLVGSLTLNTPLGVAQGGTGVNGWPSNKVVFADGSGNLNTDFDLSFDGTTLTATGIIVSGLTASRLVASDASNNLVSTITLANVVSSISDVTGSSGTGKLILSASPVFSGVVNVTSTNQIDESTLSFAATLPHLLLQQSGGTAAINKLGATLVLSKINSSRPGGAIASIQTTADPDQMGLAFYTHSSTTTGDTLIEAMRLDHSGKLLFAVAATTVVPGATSFILRNNADSVTNLVIVDAGTATFTREIAINNGGSDNESSVRRDNASTSIVGSTGFRLDNRDATDNNWVSIRFLAVDNGATIRNTGYIGLQVTSHGASATTSQMVFQTAQASAVPATRLILGALGEGADITGSSTITVSAGQKSVLKLITQTTGDDPTEDFQQNRVATTGNTQTTLLTYATTTDTVVELEATVNARQTGGAAGTTGHGAGYVVRGTYRNIGGTVTLIGAVNADYTAEDNAAWDATFTISGTDVLLRVTGETSKNITWHGHVRIHSLGS